MNPIEQKIWRFIRGDESEQEFEQWLYGQFQNPLLTELLGETLLQDSLATDFLDPHQVHRVREQLRTQLSQMGFTTCRCITWRDLQTKPIGFDHETDQVESVDDFTSRFTTVQKRTPWIFLIQCQQCSQYWHLAIDTIDDNYHLQRVSITEAEQVLSGIWPITFDSLGAVWPSSEWLKLYGYKSLEDWQARHAT